MKLTTRNGASLLKATQGVTYRIYFNRMSRKEYIVGNDGSHLYYNFHCGEKWWSTPTSNNHDSIDVSRAPKLSKQTKENEMEIKTVTYINGNDVSLMDADKLLGYIVKEEGRVKTLKAMESSKTVVIQNLIKERAKGIKQLLKFLESK